MIKVVFLSYPNCNHYDAEKPANHQQLVQNLRENFEQVVVVHTYEDFAAELEAHKLAGKVVALADIDSPEMGKESEPEILALLHRYSLHMPSLCLTARDLKLDYRKKHIYGKSAEVLKWKAKDSICNSLSEAADFFENNPFVMIVDDEGTKHEVLNAALRDEFNIVSCYAFGDYQRFKSEHETHYKASRRLLFLLDINLQQWWRSHDGGLDIAEQVKSEGYPFIILTVYDDQDNTYRRANEIAEGKFLKTYDQVDDKELMINTCYDALGMEGKLPGEEQALGLVHRLGYPSDTDMLRTLWNFEVVNNGSLLGGPSGDAFCVKTGKERYEIIPLSRFLCVVSAGGNSVLTYFNHENLKREILITTNLSTIARQLAHFRGLKTIREGSGKGKAIVNLQHVLYYEEGILRLGLNGQTKDVDVTTAQLRSLFTIIRTKD